MAANLLLVMARAPRAGAVKRRLCPDLTDEQARAVYVALLLDTRENLREIDETTVRFICPPGEGDLLFFILSTRMLPPVVVTIPIFLMYRELGWYDTHGGLIALYTAFNLSFSVWLLKGFIDEIPKEYEEAALVDGYTRLQAFIRIVIPEAVTGIAATTVFCFIFAWNEYAFALMLTADKARTAPPHIPSMIGSGLVEWAAIAAGSLFFLIPGRMRTHSRRR